MNEGFAKLAVGGWGGWTHPDTMRGVLQTYGRYSVANSGPCSHWLNQFACQHDALLVLISVGTLFFECVVVVGALLIPPEFRVVMVVASVGLHCGIAAMQSLVIGFAFLPNVAGYWLGFAGSQTTVFSPAWWAATAVVMTSLGALALRRGVPLPEDWPLSPIALFAWSHTQWRALFDRFAEGKTRLVLCADGDACQPGAKVVGKFGTSASGGVGECPTVPMVPRGANGCVYDGWEQCVGETLVFSSILRAVQQEGERMASPAWDATSFIGAVNAWLRSDRPLEEVYSGRPVIRAFYVEVADGKDGDLVVSKVLV
jgi:hypothetical protein